MRAKHTLVALTLILAAFVEFPSAQSPNRQSRAGEILVKFTPGASAAARADAHRLGGGNAIAEVARTHVQLVSVPSGTEAAAIARYSQNPNVLYAEPNFIRRIPEVNTHSDGTEVVPGDHWFKEQWALHNTGQEFYCIAWPFGGDLCFYIGTPDADIDAPEAWAISTGASTSIKVAVIDSGIDYTHPDLAANFAGGADFTSPDGDPMDDHGHGTHVAGTIAAAMNNPTGDPAAEEGVAGVAPNALILAYKVCIADGSCTDFAIEQGIAQAIVDGAKVINMSLGAPEFSQSVFDAVQDAWNAGIVIVAAAGNDGTTAPFYPAAYQNVISVAAFDEDHRRAPFSNYGDWVEISAPGNVVFSAYPIWGCGAIGTEPGDIGCYNWNSGTSMASPHVAGAAALVWSRADVTTNARVKEILLNSADPRGADTVRLDSWTIHGGLNLHNAMSFAATNQDPSADAGPDQTVTDSDTDGVASVTLDGSASMDPDGSIATYQWSEGGPAFAFGVNPTVSLTLGVHTLTLLVTDQFGATDSDTVVITVRPGNTPPTATNTSASTVVGTPVTVTLPGSDVGTCDLIFAIVQGPASGTLSAIENDACVAGSPNTDTARVLYTPGTTAGTFTFTFSSNDGSLVSNVATATVTVNPAPPSPALTVTGITPNSVSQNVGTVNFIISGTGFAIGARVSFANGTGGSAPRVISVVRDSPTQLTARVEIKSGGPRRERQWDVVVTNPDGASFTGVRMLTITP